MQTTIASHGFLVWRPASPCRGRNGNRLVVPETPTYGLVRWVYVEDLDGTHRPEYFFTTDPNMSSQYIIEAFTGRWSIEVTLQEARTHLGLETTRGWSKKTVLRVEPCLLVLFSVTALIYTELPHRYRQAERIQWQGKDTFAFSDAITSVRRYLWKKWVLAGHDQHLVLPDAQNCG